MNKRFLTSVMAIGVISLFTSSLFSQDDRGADKLKLGPVVSDLKGAGISTSTFKETSPFGDRQTLSFSVDTGKISLRSRDQFDYVKIEGLEFLGGNPGEPNLPGKIFVLTLPKDTEVNGVEVTGITYRDILKPLKISPIPQPVPIKDMKDKKGYERLMRPKPDEKIYSSEEFFPGNLVSYYTGCDNNNRYVYVRFYPLQYLPKNKQSVIVTSATIEVYYSQINKKDSEGIRLPKGVSNDAACLIIYPAAYYNAANSIKNLHESVFGLQDRIDTDSVTVEYIDSRGYGSGGVPPLANSPDALCLFGGYSGYVDNDIVGYDYQLALKILSFIQEAGSSNDNGWADYPNLRYILLLGDASKVPPSYYVYSPVGGSYDNWVPTDYFYSLDNYNDYTPHFDVGRLSARNVGEMNAMVTKITNWYNNVSSAWFKNVALCGGQTFGTWYYEGELGCNEVMNTFDDLGYSYLNGMEVSKYYHTDAGIVGDNTQFIQSSVEDAMDGTNPQGLVYLYGHGSGDAFSFDIGNLSATEVLAFGSSNSIPVVIDVSCDNAAYDTAIVSPDPDGDGVVPDYRTPSFGESILLSSAGGIAYLGGSRTTFSGNLGGTFDNGYLEPLPQEYMPEMIKYAFQAYHERAPRLGDIFTGALTNYVGVNSLSTNPYDQRTAFEWTLLGDPALPLPAQVHSANDNPVPIATAFTPPRDKTPSYNLLDMPMYEVADNSSTSIAISPDASSNVEITLVDPRNDKSDERDSGHNPADNYSFDVDDMDGGANNRGPSIYFVRVAGQDTAIGSYTKEARFYLEVVNEFIPKGDILVVDDDAIDSRYRDTLYSDRDWSSLDYEDWYDTALIDNGYILDNSGADGYQIWHVDNDVGTNAPGEGRHGEITQDVLDYYSQDTDRVVIWFTGDNSNYTFNSQDQDYLTEYLDEKGGRLFVTGQDIGYDIGSTSFYQDYLHARYIQDDIGLYTINGVVGDELSDGLSSININPAFPGDGGANQDWPSEISPYGLLASACFTYDPAGSAGVKFCDDAVPPTSPSKSYATVYLAFGLEGISERDQPRSGREQVMMAIIDWLKGKGGISTEETQRPPIIPGEIEPPSISGSSGPGSLSGCFIATACYGTPMAKEVRVLSDFRDEYLMTNSAGRFFVGAYYRTSPRIASFISEHPYLKSLVRWYLKPVVKIASGIVE